VFENQTNWFALDGDKESTKNIKYPGFHETKQEVFNERWKSYQFH
jgi:hypothetical protein